jgi:predicted ATP-grasp superfamily ATP-dependent carboligase
VLQEFIEGYDIDCSLLCNDGKFKAYTIQKGILFGNQKYAPAIGLQFLINDRLLEVVKQLMESLKWSGVAHIDLRYDKETSDYKVIEINGRFWSSLDASAAAGVNFPYLYSLKEDELLKSKILYKEIQYLNLKGLLKTVVKKPQLIFMYKYLKNNTALPLLISDPMPSVIMLLNKLKQIFRFV